MDHDSFWEDNGRQFQGNRRDDNSKSSGCKPCVKGWKKVHKNRNDSSLNLSAQGKGAEKIKHFLITFGKIGDV